MNTATGSPHVFTTGRGTPYGLAEVPVIKVASGRRKTFAEQWKLHNALTLFKPAPVT